MCSECDPVTTGRYQAGWSPCRLLVSRSCGNKQASWRQGFGCLLFRTLCKVQCWGWDCSDPGSRASALTLVNRRAAAPLGTDAAVLDPWLPGSSDTIHPQLLEGEDFETHHWS